MSRWKQPASTGSLFVYILADGEFELVLANAAHVKNVSGRKTDVNDADWLSDLLAHGLIRAGFVPDSQTQEMRSLLRTRKQLVRESRAHPADTEDAGRCQHQAGFSARGRDGHERSGDDRGADCRRE